MGFIARRLIKQNLNLLDVLVEDTNNSFFNVVEVPTTFTSGRSSFKIFGSQYLKKDVPLKMEMLDAVGNTVYIAPVDLVGEEVSPFLPYRYITVEVYRPPVNTGGIAVITLVGEIDPATVNFSIPTEFQDTYNVRYTKKTNLDVSTVINTQPILFYKNPTIVAQELVRANIVNTEVTQSVRIFSSGSGLPRADLKNKVITTKTGSQEQDDGIKETTKTNKDLDMFQSNYKYKTGLYGGMPPIVKRRGGRPIFASKEDPPFTLKVDGGGVTAKMQGGTVTIEEHTKTVKHTDAEGNTYEEDVIVDKFESKVKDVINDTTLVLEDPPVIKDPATPTGSYGGDDIDVIIDDFDDVPISMSFEDVVTTIVSSSINYTSFLDLTVKNLRPFSGDLYRIKIHGKMQSQNSGFATMADTVVESPEILLDKTSPSGFLRTGYFIDQNHINNYWTGSSVDNTTKGAAVSMTHTGSEYIDSMYISGSTRGVNEFVLVQNKSTQQFTLDKSVVYSVSAMIKGKKTLKTKVDGSVVNEGKLYFHLSGSNLSDSQKKATSGFLGAEITNPDDGQVVVLELDKDLPGIQDFDRVEHTFFPRFNLDRLKNTDTALQLRAESGEWHISDLSLRPAMDTGFSPDEYKITLPLPRTQRPDKLDIFIEYFDINNNTTEVITIEENIAISGSAFVIDGDDNLLTGSLYMGNVQGSGIEAAGANSAYIRAVGYEGFKSASISGKGGFMMWSGSVLPNSPDNYRGAGLEIHDGTTGSNASYFKFRTIDADFNGSSSFDVRSSRFFFGSETTAFVSGSNGNVEISSSNFHLSPTGNITASEFLMVGGTISEDVSVLGTVEANAISVPAGAATPSASITSQGLAKFVSGSIAGWDMTTEYISKPLTGHTNTATSRVYLAVTSSNTQNIGQGLTIYRDNDDTDAGEVKVIRIGQLSETSDLHTTGSNDYGIQVIKNKTANTYENILYIGKHTQQISGFDISVDEIKDVNENLRLKSSGQITGSQVLFTGGKIGGFEMSSTQINDTSDNLILKSSGQITASNAFITGSSNIGGWKLGSDPNTGNLILSGSGAALDGTGAALYRVGYDPATNKTEGYYIDFTPADQSSGEKYFVRFGPNFAVRDDGILFASGAKIEGQLTSSEGKIANWSISPIAIHKLTSGKYSGLSSYGDTRIFAGSDTLVTTGSAVFNVKADGVVTASAGLIGGWTIANNTVNKLTSTKYSGLSSYGDTRFFAGADNLVATGSAVFNVKADGVVTASAGLIGGWTLKTNKMLSANTRVTMSAAPGAEYFAVRNENLVEKVRIGEISVAASDKYGIKVFDDSGTADNDDGDGQLVLLGELGNKIGGWEITSTQIRSIPTLGLGQNYGESETGLILRNTGTIETSDFATGLKGWRISSEGNGTAEFENARIRGTLKTAVFEKESINVVGGQLMVANSTTLEPLRNVSGSIAAGVPSMSAADVTMSVANVTGFSAGEIIKAKKVNDSGFVVEYMQITGSKRYSTDPNLAQHTGSVGSRPPLDPDGLRGELYVHRGFGATRATASVATTLNGAISSTSATTITVDDDAKFGSGSGIDSIYQEIIKIDYERMKVITGSNNTLTVIRDFHGTTAATHADGASVQIVDADAEFLAGLVSTAQSYDEGQVIVSTGKYNESEEISSGYMLMNANPNDISTPYMQIVERTGSGVYDLQLRAQLGDLSGLSSGYLYGEEEPGFGIYTDNGFFRGTVTAMTGSIKGILWINTSNAESMRLGRNVNGSSDGMFINSHNYWYTTGAFKMGTASNHIRFDGSSTLDVNFEKILINTSTFQVSSSLNSGTIRLGNSVTGITSTTNTGVYMDGTGVFRVGESTNGDNFIYFDGTTTQIKSTNIEMAGTNFKLEASAHRAGEMWLGTIQGTNDSSGVGFYATSSGYVRMYGGSEDYITIGGGTLAIRTNDFDLQGTNMALNNTRMYLGEIQSDSDDSGAGVYMDNGGAFRVYGDSSNYITVDGGTMTVAGTINIVGGDLAGVTKSSISGSGNATSASLAGRQTPFETQIVLDSAGMGLWNAAGTTQIAEYGSTITLAPDVSAATTDSVVIASGGVKIYDTNTEFIHITADGLKVYDGDASNPTAVFGAITYVGLNASEHIKITNSALTLVDGNGAGSPITYLTMNSSGLQIGDAGSGITLSTSGDATFNGTINIQSGLASSISGSLGTNSSLIRSLTATGISGSANELRTASSSLATRVEITSGGLKLRTAVGGTTLADYGSTITLGNTSDAYMTLSSTEMALFDEQGTQQVTLNTGRLTLGGTDGSTTQAVRINSNGVNAYYDSSNYVEVNSSGVTVHEDNNPKAIFGSTTMIGSSGTGDMDDSSTDDCIKIEAGGVTIFQDNTHKAKVTSLGLTVYEGHATNTVAQFGSTTYVGLQASEHIKVTSTGLEIKDGGTTRLSASAAGLEIGHNFKVDASGNVDVAGKLFVGGKITIPTKNNAIIENGVEASSQNNSWSTLTAYGTLSQPNDSMIRMTCAGSLSNAAGQTRIFYHFDGNQFTTGHRYKVRGEITQTVASTIVLRIGTTSYGGATYVGTNIATAAGSTFWELDFVKGAVTQDDFFFFNNGGTAPSNSVIDLKNITITDMNATGSASEAFASIGGFKIDGGALYSGYKVADATFAAAGAITIGSSGYIGANQFYIDTSGNAFFKGTVDIANALMGTSAGSTSASGTRQGFADFFEISGADLRAKTGAKFGSNSFSSLIDEMNTTSCCFLPGTKVLMSNGIGKNIEDVKVGDVVKSWNEQINSIENSEVLDLESPIREGYYNLSFDGGELKVTNEHPIYIKNKGWCSIEPEKTKEYHSHLDNVKQIEIGDLLYTSDKQWKNITSFDYVEKQVQTYNLSSIENNHTFFANNILVHNKLLEFSQGHNYFVSSSISLEPGDAVKLNSDNFLEKTDSTKSTDCIGIVWDSVNTILSSSFVSKLKYDTIEEQTARLNNELSSSVHVDSTGTIITGSNYILMKVASLGDSREVESNYDIGSNNVLVITGSMMGFKICNQGGLVSKGDLLCTSDTAGYLMKQPSEYVITSFSASVPQYEERQNINSFTVGKVMESCSFDSNGKVERVYGYLYCG